MNFPDLSWLTEPVRRTAFVKSVITIITYLGVAVSTQQETAIQDFLGAAVVLTTTFGLFDWFKLRGQVTPTANPQLPEGTTVATTDAKGDVTGSTTV